MREWLPRFIVWRNEIAIIPFRSSSDKERYGAHEILSAGMTWILGDNEITKESAYSSGTYQDHVNLACGPLSEHFTSELFNMVSV